MRANQRRLTGFHQGIGELFFSHSSTAKTLPARRSACLRRSGYAQAGATARRHTLLCGSVIQKRGRRLIPRSPYEKMLADPRILGDKDFIEKILKESIAYEGKFQLPLIQIQKKMQSIIEERCKEEGIRIDELRMGSRRHRISKVRSRIGWQLVNDLGVPLVEVARQLGVSTSGISKILQRKSGSKNHNK